MNENETIHKIFKINNSKIEFDGDLESYYIIKQIIKTCHISNIDFFTDEAVKYLCTCIYNEYENCGTKFTFEDINNFYEFISSKCLTDIAVYAAKLIAFFINDLGEFIDSIFDLINKIKSSEIKSIIILAIAQNCPVSSRIEDLIMFCEGIALKKSLKSLLDADMITDQEQIFKNILQMNDPIFISLFPQLATSDEMIQEAFNFCISHIGGSYDTDIANFIIYNLERFNNIKYFTEITKFYENGSFAFKISILRGLSQKMYKIDRNSVIETNFLMQISDDLNDSDSEFENLIKNFLIVFE